MSECVIPRIADWYKTTSGELFEIVALDEDDRSIEIQYFDGMVEELDLDTWEELEAEAAEPPEDWSGSLDIEKEDYGVDLDFPSGETRTSPLKDF